jgi:hypothetical protein
MRAVIWTPILTLTLFLVPPAFAAPTCQTENGDTIKCGAPGAMPVGWTAPEENRQISRLPGPASEELWTALAMLGLLFSLIALMPKFDGSRDADWDVPSEKREE